MKHAMLLPTVLISIMLSACERPTVINAVPGQAGPPSPAGVTGSTGDTGATGNTGATGDPGERGKTGGDTVVIVPPPQR